jgi:hypothetical protein
MDVSHIVVRPMMADMGSVIIYSRNGQSLRFIQMISDIIKTSIALASNVSRMMFHG